MVERGALTVRKARSDPKVRAFVQTKIVPELKRNGGQMNLRKLTDTLHLKRLNNQPTAALKIFMDAMSTAAKSFAPIRIFDTIFPDMFLVSQETQNTNLVTLVTPTLPPVDSGPIPAEPTREPARGDAALTPRLAATFQKYAAGLKAHIAQQPNGTLTISKVGIYLRQQPGYTVAFQGSALGADGGTKKILTALGFRLTQAPGKMAVVRNPP